MTVEELITELQKYPSNTEIVPTVFCDGDDEPNFGCIFELSALDDNTLALNVGICREEEAKIRPPCIHRAFTKRLNANH